MKQINLFKIEYNWYEGEHEEILLGKAITEEQFEFDLKEAKKYVQSQIGKKDKKSKWNVECLPEYYRELLDYLVKKHKYQVCSIDNNISYEVDDNFDKKISITKHKQVINREEL